MNKRNGMKDSSQIYNRLYKPRTVNAWKNRLYKTREDDFSLKNLFRTVRSMPPAHPTNADLSLRPKPNIHVRRK